MPRNIFLIFLAFGAAIAGGSSFYYAWCWSDVLEGRTWPTAQGTIRAIGVEEHVGRDSQGHSTYTYYPRLSYSYRAGNRELHGDRVWLSGNQFFRDQEDAEAFARSYAIGQSVPVFHDPEDPGDSALLIETPPWQILLFTAGGLLWIALSLAFRLSGDGPPKRRFGRCRGCGARLPFDRHVSFGELVPDESGVLVPAPDGLPCPRCDMPDPLNSWRNKKGCIFFGGGFAAIWAVGLYYAFLG